MTNIPTPSEAVPVMPGTPIKDANLWVRDLNKRLEGYTDVAERLGGSQLGHGFAGAFNLASGILTIGAAFFPFMAPTASFMRLATSGLMGIGVINRFGLVDDDKSFFKKFGKSTAFVKSAEALKGDIATMAGEAQTAVPEGLIGAVDKYRDGFQSMHNISKLDIAAKFAISAGVVAASVLTGGGVLLAFAGAAAVALNAEHVIYSVYAADRAKKVEETGKVISEGVAELGSQMRIRRWADERAAAVPAPVAV